MLDDAFAAMILLTLGAAGYGFAFRVTEAALAGKLGHVQGWDGSFPVSESVSSVAGFSEKAASVSSAFG